jgi:hypothetical protein
LAFGLASPAGLPSPVGRSLPRRPIEPVCQWHLRRNTFSFLVHAFRVGRVLSHISLSSGPQLSAPSPTPRRPTSTAPPPNSVTPGHPVPPSSAPRMAASRLNSPRHQDPLLNLTVFNGVKDINATVTPRPPLPGMPPVSTTPGPHHTLSPLSRAPSCPPSPLR